MAEPGDPPGKGNGHDKGGDGGQRERERGVAVKERQKTKKPPMYRVLLHNDDYTTKEFVVMVLRAVFSMSEDQAYSVMATAHQKGACVVAVFTKDVAETKANEATETARAAGHPLMFTTEPED